MYTLFYECNSPTIIFSLSLTLCSPLSSSHTHTRTFSLSLTSLLTPTLTFSPGLFGCSYNPTSYNPLSSLRAHLWNIHIWSSQTISLNSNELKKLLLMDGWMVRMLFALSLCFIFLRTNLQNQHFRTIKWMYVSEKVHWSKNCIYFFHSKKKILLKVNNYKFLPKQGNRLRGFWIYLTCASIYPLLHLSLQ